MRAWLIPVLLLVLLLGLIGVDRGLASRDAATRSSSNRVRQVVPPEKRDMKEIMGVHVEDLGRNEVHSFAVSKEGWRSTSRFGAMGEESRIQGLLDGLAQAQGIVQTRDRSRLGEFGLSGSKAIRLTLFRKRGELYFTLDVGNALPSGNGSYVRVSGSDEVIALDTNLREELSRPEGTDLPPLLDPHFIPGGWPRQQMVQRIRVERDDGERVELVRREKRLPPEELKMGRLPWDWVLVRDGKEEVCPPGPSNGFANFLQRAPYLTVIDPQTTPPGLEPPRARITLEPGQGEPCELQVGRPVANGNAALRNGYTKNLFVLAKEVAELLAPAAADVLSAEETNPWDALLRRKQEEAGAAQQMPRGFTLPGAR